MKISQFAFAIGICSLAFSSLSFAKPPTGEPDASNCPYTFIDYADIPLQNGSGTYRVGLISISNNNKTWEYGVCELDGKDLSHFVLGLYCPDEEAAHSDAVAIETSGSVTGPQFNAPDPTTLQTGIKWDTGGWSGDNDYGKFSITLSDDVVFDPNGTIDVAVKAGNHQTGGVGYDSIKGPIIGSCNGIGGPDSICNSAYFVDDQGLNNSQIYTVDIFSGEIATLGNVRSGLDLEGLDLDFSLEPALYASAGDDSTTPGHLYRIDHTDGSLIDLGSTGYNEVDGISFAPDNTLWGIAQDAGLIKISRDDQGELDVSTAILVMPLDNEYEDLSWNSDGTRLYAIRNNHGSNDPDAESDFNITQSIYVYDLVAESFTPVCQAEIAAALGKNEIEAIEAFETYQEGVEVLLIGYHRGNKLGVMIVDGNCNVESTTSAVNDNGNYDVEGITLCPIFATP